MSTGEFQSLTGKLEDVTHLLVVLEKLVQIQVIKLNCAVSSLGQLWMPLVARLLPEKKKIPIYLYKHKNNCFAHKMTSQFQLLC